MTRREFVIASTFGCGKPLRAEARIGVAGNVAPVSSYYNGWPTLARRSNGTLILVYSGGREAHVCPFGRVEMMLSRDGGATWTWPRTLMDSDLDDRDAGVVETGRRTLLVATFTSTAYEALLGKSANWAPEKIERWQAAHRRTTAAERAQQLGSYMLRSTDGGVSWSTPYRVPINSPHGPALLQDGRLLYAGKDLYGSSGDVGVCESKDDGVTWQWLAKIQPRTDDLVKNYHELHLVEGTPGKLVLHIRNHNEADKNETLQCESEDGGISWSRPRAIGVWGLPSHLLRLRDGRLVMSYGYRRAPFGIQARISTNDGAKWSDPIILYSGGASGDLGYPSTVELGNGNLLTIWYELMPGSSRAGLRQVRWDLSS